MKRMYLGRKRERTTLIPTTTCTILLHNHNDGILLGHLYIFKMQLESSPISVGTFHWAAFPTAATATWFPLDKIDQEKWNWLLWDFNENSISAKGPSSFILYYNYESLGRCCRVLHHFLHAPLQLGQTRRNYQNDKLFYNQKHLT